MVRVRVSLLELYNRLRPHWENKNVREFDYKK